MGAAERSLVLSYPRIDLDRVRPRVPSFYALEILRAAEGRLPGYDELMARAESATLARVGWPAPLDGQRAIDTAEYDLSVLQEVLVAPPEQTVGAARYLLGENPHLARALRFRARRWSVRVCTPADGLGDPGPGAAAARCKTGVEPRREPRISEIYHQKHFYIPSGGPEIYTQKNISPAAGLKYTLKKCFRLRRA